MEQSVDLFLLPSLIDLGCGNSTRAQRTPP